MFYEPGILRKKQKERKALRSFLISDRQTSADGRVSAPNIIRDFHLLHMKNI